MFRRLSWRIGVKPSAMQIDQLVSTLGFSVGSTVEVSLYDWLFMIEWLGLHKKEDSFLGQYGRAIAAFGMMDEGGEEVEEESWERLPKGKKEYTDFMSAMRVEGLDTVKEKVKVRSPKRMDSYKKSSDIKAGQVSRGSKITIIFTRVRIVGFLFLFVVAIRGKKQ